MYINQNMIVFI